MMNREINLESKLRQFRPFDALDSELISGLSRYCSIQDVSDGHVLIKQGESLGFLFAVLAGSLRTVQVAPDGKTTIEHRMRSGQLFGWVSAFDQRPVNATIIAQGKVKLILIPLNQAKRIVLESPKLSEAVFMHLCEMLRKVEGERLILSLPNAFQRVYLHIYRLFSSEKGAPNQVLIPKQNEIATLVNTSRETVSRAIQSLIKHGVLAKTGHTISVNSLEDLKKVAQIGHGDYL